MSGPDKNDKHEIIIVKRRSGGHDEGHHGGVWKIAFADFMTAMMAFFLVLWIVNSTSKETRSSIARYFNPVQLADTTAARKGLREAKDEFDASATREGKETGGAPAAAGGKSEGKGEDRSDGKNEAGGAKADAKPDPHAKSEAKSDAKADAKADAKSDAKSDSKAKDKAESKDKSDAKAKAEPAPAPGPAARRLRPDGEPLSIDRPARFDEADLARDPQGALTALAGEIGPPTATPDAPRPFADPFAPVTPKLAGRAAAKEAQAARPPEAASNGAQESKAPESKAQEGKAQEGKAQEAKGADAPSDKALADELAAAAKKTFAGLDAPGLEVRRTPDGVLISLTDKESFEMFAVGSSEPHPRLVALMARVAAALGKTPGEVVLRGHTDARPFRSGANDNWRLSAARAAMARQMLLKGGFDAARVARVEGLAERSPRRPDDPLAAENRRIEILVRDAAAPPGAGTGAGR